jgi:phosphate transport system substrate-binding protein
MACFNSSQKGDKTESATSGEIYITVDETFKLIMEEEIALFHHWYPNTKVNALYLPGEEAIRRMMSSDSFRLAITTRSLTPEETKYVTSQNTKVMVKPLAQDAIAMVVNAQNKDSVLTLQQAKDIFMGKITKWTDINPHSTLGEIILVFDHEKSSTVQHIRDSIVMGEKVSSKGFSAKSNPNVLEYVQKTPNAVGIVGINWISDHDDNRSEAFFKGIKIMYLETTSKCQMTEKICQPTQSAVKMNCYPLQRFMYSVNREPGFKLGTGFVAFLANGNHGQRVILKAGLVPYFLVSRTIMLSTE